MSPWQVLLIEDTHQQALHWREALELDPQQRFQVQLCPDVPSALKSLEKRHPDCMLLELPPDGGVEFWLMLRRTNGSLHFPVVMLGPPEETVAILALQAGASDYVFKDGLQPWVLRRSLERVIEGRTREQHCYQLEQALLNQQPSTQKPQLTHNKDTLQRYRLLFERARDIIWLLRPDGQIVEVNQAAVAAYGYSREELLGMNVRELREPSTLSLLVEQLHQASSGSVEFESVHVSKDGRVFPVEVHASSAEFADERLVIAIIRDISAHKQAQQRLKLLAEVASSLAAAQTLSQVRKVILEQVSSALGADGGGIRRVVDAHLVLDEYDLGTHMHVGNAQRFIRVPLEAHHPAAEAVRNKKAVLIHHAQDFIQRYPALAELVIQHKTQANAHLPLKRGEEVFGVLSLNFAERHFWDEDEQAFAQNLADRAALAYARARAEEALRQSQAAQRQSEARFRRVFSGNMVAMGVWTKQGSITDANQALLNLLGYTRAEIETGEVSWNQITPPEYLYLDKRALLEIAQTGVCTPFEKEYIRKDGLRIPVIVGGARFDERGETGYFFAVDLSERKHAEEALRQSEAEFRAMFELSGIGLAQSDPVTGRLLRVNQRYCEILGYSQDELLGRTFPELTHPEDREKDWQMFKAFVLGQTPEYHPEKRCVCKDGRVVWVMVMSRMLRGPQGQPLRTVVAILDITERKLAEAALQASEARYRALAQAGGSAVWRTDVRGRLIFADELFQERTGLNVQRAQGRGWLRVIHSQDRQRALLAWQDALKNQTEYNLELRIQSPDGKYHWVQSRAVPVFDSQGMVREWVGADSEISQRKQAEAELTELLQQTKQSEKEALALAQIANALSLTEPLGTNLSAIAQQVSHFCGALACSIKLYSDDQKEVVLLGSYNQPEGLEEGINVLRNAGVQPPSYWAIKTRALRVVQNFRNRALSDPRYKLLHSLLRKVRWNTAVAVPILQENQILGTVLTYYASGEEPSALDILQLSTVTSQVSLVVQNMRLLQQAQEKAALEERARLARDLHDSVSQALYGVTLGVHSARNSLRRGQIEGTSRSLEYVLQMAETATAEMKNLIFELRPESLEQEGLVAALHKHTSALKLRYPQTFEIELGAEPPLALKTKEMLLRIAQEALTNALKHAQARHIRLSLTVQSTQVVLEVEDDGQGFDTQGNFPGNLGLRSMQERVAAVGGVLSVKSEPGKETLVHVELRGSYKLENQKKNRPVEVHKSTPD